MVNATFLSEIANYEQKKAFAWAIARDRVYGQCVLGFAMEAYWEQVREIANARLAERRSENRKYYLKRAKYYYTQYKVWEYKFMDLDLD